jgi:hypothetical protein
MHGHCRVDTAQAFLTFGDTRNGKGRDDADFDDIAAGLE